ncbi:hypothetical protein BGZ83_005010 [Gryganskiella cystojenkinii]|nr:hypothetical protein BGZ83_005010 [Gryganskiella cystojenkinii]
MVSEKLTDKAIATECAVFLAAGADTAASIMGYTLMFLAKNPVKLARLREEIDFATANNADGALPSLDQISQLPYFNACINETLRIHPIVPTGIPREVNEDMTINGYFFPKGTILLANYPQLHWSEEYFSQAHKFIPERWLPSESPFPPVIDKVFYPFSAGVKSCIGKGFAMMSLRLALAALVLNYDMERATPGLDDDILEATPGPDQGTSEGDGHDDINSGILLEDAADVSDQDGPVPDDATHEHVPVLEDNTRDIGEGEIVDIDISESPQFNTPVFNRVQGEEAIR